jgi:oligopeptide transport system substrate-binding protein
MSLAIDRQSIIDNIAQADQLPATGFTPKGMPGFDAINPDSEWLPASGDMDRAKELMDKVANPKRTIDLLINDSPGHREIAVAVQAMWKELGLTVKIRQQEWAQFLESLGPPPDASIDVYRNGWIGDYVDGMNFLELWTCKSGNNNSNYCDPTYDALVAKARRTQDNNARYAIYGQLEDKLLGKDGAVPFSPIYWYTYVQLERPTIKDSLNVNLLNQTDYSKVVEVEPSA